MCKTANEYTKKTIYFNLENQDIYDFIQSKGRMASKYICDLIRADLSKDNVVIDENTVKMMLSEIEVLKRQLNTHQTQSAINHNVIKNDSHVEIDINQEFDF